MKFRCDRDALSEALQTVQRGVSTRPGIPALTGVLIEATTEGRLELTTTDLEVSARLAIDVQVQEAGIALVPARLLSDTVKSLSDAPVDVETDASSARIRCAAYEGSLRLLPAEDFPGLQEPSGTRITVEAGQSLQEIAGVAKRSAGLAQDISQATAQQVRSAETVAASVQSISGVAVETEESVRQMRKNVEELVHVAEELTSTLSRFTLPA